MKILKVITSLEIRNFNGYIDQSLKQLYLGTCLRDVVFSCGLDTPGKDGLDTPGKKSLAEYYM